MANFLQINGVNVPVHVDGAESEQQLLMDSARTASMAMSQNLEAEKGRWEFTMPIQTRANALAFRKLINGDGHYWNFDATPPGLYSSKGLSPTVSTGCSQVLTQQWLGAGSMQVTATNNFQTAIGIQTAMTVMCARKVGAGAWSHVIKNDAGTVWTDGVLTGSAAWLTITLSTGTVRLDADGASTTYFDELVVLPYRLLSDWPSQVYAEQNPGGNSTQWGALRQLKVRGDVILEGGVKTVFGRVSRETIVPAAADYSSRELAFELEEV